MELEKAKNYLEELQKENEKLKTKADSWKFRYNVYRKCFFDILEENERLLAEKNSLKKENEKLKTKATKTDFDNKYIPIEKISNKIQQLKLIYEKIPETEIKKELCCNGEIITSITKSLDKRVCEITISILENILKER